MSESFELMQSTFNDYNNFFEDLNRSYGRPKSPKRGIFRFISVPKRWSIWTWWFWIMIPLLIVVYFGARGPFQRVIFNLFDMDKEIEKLNQSTSHEILELKQRLEEAETKYMEKVRKLVDEQIRMYDADKTGLADYALESSGAYIIGVRDTELYKEVTRQERVWGIPLWYTSVNPRTVIQRKTHGVNAGECWPFVGEHGHLIIKLAHNINVTSVSYEHLPKELAPLGNINSAPKEFIVWGYNNGDDLSTRLELGRFIYDIEKLPLQMFDMMNYDSRWTAAVEFEILSNHGAPLTCLYRFRVHGELIQSYS